VTSRAAVAVALVTALLLAPVTPASAGPLRRVVRLAVRFVEARQAVDRARELRERWRETRRSSGAWRAVVARGSSTAPPATASRPE
jgi:hypothetical protein